ncbi:MAG: hypothetical protein WBM87_03330, partial [Woeseiaceae bacterium]
VLLTPVSVASERLPLFRDESIIKAVLTAPIAQAYAQRDQDVRLYMPGKWVYADSDGKNHRLDVSIRTRGLFRREYCDLPPIQLNFKKKQVKDTLFAGQNKLKVVAPCKNGAQWQQKVVLEYLAYRTLQILTDASFSTRLVRLSYVDSDEKKEPWTDLVFVIEDDDDMADRLGLVKLGVVANQFNQLDRAATALAELFQLLIANNDFSVLQGPKGEVCCHNSEILAPKGNADSRIPVPFDFDLSGLVNAKYAAPPSSIPIRFVRTRYYRGLCHPPGVLENAMAQIQSRRAEILALYAGTPLLEPRTKESTYRYIAEFFELLDDPKRVEKEIVGRCRGEDELADMLSRD